MSEEKGSCPRSTINNAGRTKKPTSHLQTRIYVLGRREATLKKMLLSAATSSCVLKPAHVEGLLLNVSNRPKTAEALGLPSPSGKALQYTLASAPTQHDTLLPTPRAQKSPKALHNMVFGPTNLKT